MTPRGDGVVTLGLDVSKKLNGLNALNELNEGTKAENADCCCCCCCTGLFRMVFCPI